MPAWLDSERLLMVLKAASADRRCSVHLRCLTLWTGDPPPCRLPLYPRLLINSVFVGWRQACLLTCRLAGRQAGSASHSFPEVFSSSTHIALCQAVTVAFLARRCYLEQPQHTAGTWPRRLSCQWLRSRGRQQLLCLPTSTRC